MKIIKCLRVCAGAMLIAGLLGACGGGGGSPGTPVAISPGAPTGTSTTTTTTAKPSVAMAIFNSAGAQVVNIGLSGNFVARATVRDAKGAAVANKLVSFKMSDATLALVTPATALTNASGVAEVAVAPASTSATGAATLSGSAALGIETTTTSASGAVTTATDTTGVGAIDFSVSAPSLSLAALTTSSASIASGGNTGLVRIHPPSG